MPKGLSKITYNTPGPVTDGLVDEGKKKALGVIAKDYTPCGKYGPTRLRPIGKGNK